MKPLVIKTSRSYPAERDYIFSVLFNEFLGLDYIIKRCGEEDVHITDVEKKCCLIIPDALFLISDKKWLAMESLPKQPLEVWDPCTMGLENCAKFQSIPVIYGTCQSYANRNTQLSYRRILYLPIDIFGSCFFMLTRYEEMVKPDRDEHDRFPLKAMLSFQEGFVERPIVNEYLEILWACLKNLWPGIRRKKRGYRLILSHDVDQIFSVVEKPLNRIIRRISGDIVVRRNLTLALKSTKAAWTQRIENDPCSTFDFLMALSERNGIKSIFNFMTDLGYTAYDQRYNIDHPWVCSLLRWITENGHKIGFHSTYGSYLSQIQTKTEFIRLKRAAEKEGVKQDKWGGRAHYLRWKNPATWQHWEDAGLNYDSTLGFSDIVGFRAGCCYEYHVFNLKSKKKLNLMEQSLIAMADAAIKSNGSFRVGYKKKLLDANEVCKKYKGDFTMLWHNNNVITKQQRRTYVSVIQSLNC